MQSQLVKAVALSLLNTSATVIEGIPKYGNNELGRTGAMLGIGFD
jgi:hypothetical protein